MEKIDDFSYVDVRLVEDVASEIVGKRFVDLHDLQIFAEQQSNWTQVPDWEDLGDKQILEKLCAIAKPFGEVLVVNDASYVPGRGGFKLRGEEISNFVLSFLEKFGECFFNGDTFIFSPGQRMFWMFHHDGALFVWGAPRN